MEILPRGAGTHRKERVAGLISRASVTNLGAQGAALASVSVASLMVARAGGPTVVGEYALVRVLPWLFGVVLSCGLPTVVSPGRKRSSAGRVGSGLVSLTGGSGTVGC